MTSPLSASYELNKLLLWDTAIIEPGRFHIWNEIRLVPYMETP